MEAAHNESYVVRPGLATFSTSVHTWMHWIIWIATPKTIYYERTEAVRVFRIYLKKKKTTNERDY